MVLLQIIGRRWKILCLYEGSWSFIRQENEGFLRWSNIPKGKKENSHRVKTTMDCPILGPVLPKTFFFSLPLLCSSLYCRGANCNRAIPQASLLVDLQLDFTYEKNQWKIECPLMCVGQHCWQRVNLPTWNQLYQTP